MPHRLILASTSRYRRELLNRLRVPFECIAPQVDETPLPGETPSAVARRLAAAKALAVARLHPSAWVIGSDQVLDHDGQALGKPGNHAAALAQLQALRGHSVVFQTAVAVVAPAAAAAAEQAGRQADGQASVELVSVQVRFRDLADDEIEHYLRLDRPYDCAGSAKCETLGIGLLDAIQSDDPTALIGLPLISTLRLLRAAGYDALRLAR